MELGKQKFRFIFSLVGILVSPNLFSNDLVSQLSSGLDCVIQPYLVTDVSSSVNGVLENVFVEKSHVVNKGQKLAKLESSVEKTTVSLAKARAEQQQDVLTKKLNWEFSVAKQKRASELYLNKVVTSHEIEEAQMNSEISRLEYERGKALQKIAEIELERAEAALELRTIRSPISGVIIEKYLSPGESVKDRPLFKLAQLDPLRIFVIAEAKMFGKIIPGTVAEVRTNINPGVLLKATVDIVAPVIDAASDTFDIMLTLPNPNHQLPGGLRCKIKFDASTG